MQRLSVLIICFLLVLSVSAQDDVVMLTVDTSEVIGEVGDYVYGVNHGPWANIPANWIDRMDTIGVNFIRFPGGNWGDENSIQSYHLRDIMFWAERMGDVEVSISVNLERGTPEEAADTVRMVIENDFDITYWSIGNEPNLFEDYSTEQHNREWREFAEAMLAVDPDIQFIGPDISQYQGNPTVDPKDDEGLLYLDEFLRANGDMVDIVSVHRYPFPSSMTGDVATIPDIRENTREWETIIPTLHETVLALTGEAKPIAVTEINTHWSSAMGFDAAPDSHYNAIWWADVLGQMIVGDVFMVNYFTLQSGNSIGGYGLLARREARPTFYTYQMYQHFGNQLLNASSDDEDVSIFASFDADNNLTLIVVNLEEEARTVNFDLGDFEASSTEHWLFDLETNAELQGTLDITESLTLSPQSITALVIAGS
ncbi:MAG: hypothetical protein AAFV98_00455 [Chloroflexota bacterium]